MRKIWFSGQGLNGRALSAGGRIGQAPLATLALLLAAPLLATRVLATPGGDLATLPVGDYICELPGDATGPAGLHVPAEDFSVVSASSYRAAGAMGSYLLTGEQLTMTGGPHQGKRYRRQSEGFIRRLDDAGNPGDLRCVLRKKNNE